MSISRTERLHRKERIPVKERNERREQARFKTSDCARKSDRSAGKDPISNCQRAKLTAFACDPLFHYVSLLLRQTARDRFRKNARINFYLRERPCLFASRTSQPPSCRCHLLSRLEKPFTVLRTYVQTRSRRLRCCTKPEKSWRGVCNSFRIEFSERADSVSIASPYLQDAESIGCRMSYVIIVEQLLTDNTTIKPSLGISRVTTAYRQKLTFARRNT